MRRHRLQLRRGAATIPLRRWSTRRKPGALSRRPATPCANVAREAESAPDRWQAQAKERQTDSDRSMGLLRIRASTHSNTGFVPRLFALRRSLNTPAGYMKTLAETHSTPVGWRRRVSAAWVFLSYRVAPSHFEVYSTNSSTVHILSENAPRHRGREAKLAVQPHEVVVREMHVYRG